jgi:DNA polymerase-3 subunit delta
MRLRADQLDEHLDQARSKGLAPVYLISGDVPLLIQEAADDVRRQARAAGCFERIVLEAERGFDWQQLLQESSGLSLFAEQRLIEIRLPSAKPGDAGSKALQAYVDQLPASANGSVGDVLLIITGKIEKQSQSSKWFKALDRVGVIVQYWPLEGRELSGWIDRRLQMRGLQGESEAVRLLADRSEGNLLACAQEVDKLQLLYGEAGGIKVSIDAAAVMNAVVDSARYDVFVLVDSALAGDVERVSRIVAGLHAEGTEPIVILWALARELRMLLDIVVATAAGAPLAAQLTRLRVWDKRKSIVSTAMQRLRQPALRAMLVRAARLDRLIKGRATGNVWDELLQLALMLAGVRPLKMVS